MESQEPHRRLKHKRRLHAQAPITVGGIRRRLEAAIAVKSVLGARALECVSGGTAGWYSLVCGEIGSAWEAMIATCIDIGPSSDLRIMSVSVLGQVCVVDGDAHVWES